MKRYVDIVLVIPAGPGTSPVFLADTIMSFIHYTASTYQVIVIDDSGQDLGRKVQQSIPEVEVLYNKKPSGAWAGLYVSLAGAFSYALEKYQFKLLMKMDTDALVIGPEPEKEAFELFSSNTSLGIAGQYKFDYSGKPWDIGWPRDRILNGATTWKFIRRPLPNAVLRKLYIKAAQNGYIAGESVFGGSCFYSHSLLLTLHQHKLLPNKLLGQLNLGEDHIFSLLTKAVGFDLDDLSLPGLPLALAWKELPASPEQLYAEHKKVIHSTRKWEEMDEEQIRNFFKEKRQSQNSISSSILTVE
ncbi:MAG TPA: hypothetical protein VGB56_05740 [Flavisolibacter sp.]|jgi:hypothetical protein